MDFSSTNLCNYFFEARKSLSSIASSQKELYSFMFYVRKHILLIWIFHLPWHRIGILDWRVSSSMYVNIVWALLPKNCMISVMGDFFSRGCMNRTRAILEVLHFYWNVLKIISKNYGCRYQLWADLWDPSSENDGTKNQTWFKPYFPQIF